MGNQGDDKLNENLTKDKLLRNNQKICSTFCSGLLGGDGQLCHEGVFIENCRLNRTNRLTCHFKKDIESLYLTLLFKTSQRLPSHPPSATTIDIARCSPI